MDDEAISRRAIVYALEKARLKSVNVEDPQEALQLLDEDEFDLIFLDVDMPNMSGFELCAKLRAMPQHQKTPVVFVTSLNDFDSRASSTMAGGNDFIGKPFLFIELTVKALIHVMRNRLRPQLEPDQPCPTILRWKKRATGNLSGWKSLWNSMKNQYGFWPAPSPSSRRCNCSIPRAPIRRVKTDFQAAAQSAGIRGRRPARRLLRLPFARNRLAAVCAHRAGVLAHRLGRE